MTYVAKDFSALLGLKGLSENLLKAHFALYQGYIANINNLLELLDTKKAGTPEYSEPQRRFGWEWNGMRLHELYFENLKKGGSRLDENSKLFKKISDDLGSYEYWEKSFRAAGAMRGIGWIITYYEPRSGKIYNCWITEHDTGHLAGAVPLLVMDIFEHAYMTDYGIKKVDYIDAFFKIIDWDTVAKRYEATIL